MILAMEKRFAEGKWNVKPPYGYRLVEGLLVVEPAEAMVVRRLFTRYLGDGLGVKLRLRQAGAPAPSPTSPPPGWKGRWSASSGEPERKYSGQQGFAGIHFSRNVCSSRPTSSFSLWVRVDRLVHLGDPGRLIESNVARHRLPGSRTHPLRFPSPNLRAVGGVLP